METKYVCSECESEDRDHQSNTPAPLALVCWKCGAGSKMSVPDQIRAQYGMLPEQRKKEEIN